MSPEGVTVINPDDVRRAERVRQAAPELLAALKDMVSLYNTVRDMVGESVKQKLARADAAIQRAEQP